jgi:YidC/Oxa1 family membrane protein insertase
MDRTSWIAVIVCFLLLLAYGPVVNYLYPPPPRTAQTPTASESNPAVAADAVAPLALEPRTAAAEFAPAATANASLLTPEQIILLENAFVRVAFTTHGGAIQTVSLKQHLAHGTDPVVLNQTAKLPLLNLRGWGDHAPTHDYTVESSSASSVTFTRSLRPGLRLSRTYTLGDDYQIRLTQTVFNTGTVTEALPPYDLHLGTTSSVYFTPTERTYIGLSWFTQDKDYVKHKIPEFDGFRPLGIPFSSGKTVLENKEGQTLQWAAVKSQFFAVVVACEDFTAIGVRGVRELLPDFRPKNEPVPDGITADLTAPGVSVGANSSYQQNFLIYAGPKEDRRLRPLPYQIDHVMEFGWMGPVSRPLLMFMNTVHGWVGNYGLAIVLLTVVVKAVLWWPQGAANRSMKRMATVGPLIKELQDKHKDNPQKLNEKMLEVYRDYGVNPVGGCLPMLIQMPIFLGFYYMLLSAIELRHADFLWISDLSQPDTIFRLPIPGFELPFNPMPLVMAATMYWSMHITPQPAGTDNPAYKIMKFMPLLFLLFCYNFSSALSLYWTVQNLLSIVQIKVNNLTPAPTLDELKAEAVQRRKQRKINPWKRP